MINISELIWDELNIAHIARHGVSQEEVAEVCVGNPFIERTPNGRLFVTGPTKNKRVLAIVLSPKVGGVYYPVMARVADKKERLIYIQQKGGDNG